MITTTFVRIIDSRFQPVTRGHEVLTSLEGENPGKSIKDRIVFGELSEWIHQGKLKPGDSVAEISAGSTAFSLAYYCQAFGLKCSLFVPTTLQPELIKKLEALGAQLHLVDPQSAYEKFDDFIRETGIRKLDQFGNSSLRRHYHSMAFALNRIAKINVLIGAVGTGHSLVGMSQEMAPSVQLFSAEPTKPGAVSGIRNLRLESFGEKDPCDSSQFQRIEIGEEDFFPYSKIQTDHGWIEISDSFRVVLGAIEKLSENQLPMSIFAVGAKNSRVS